MKPPKFSKNHKFLIYYCDIRTMYERAGYKSIVKWSDERIWETYKRQVGYIARFHF